MRKSHNLGEKKVIIPQEESRNVYENTVITPLGSQKIYFASSASRSFALLCLHQYSRLNL